MLILGVAIILIALVVALLDIRADKKQDEQLDRDMEAIRADLAKRDRAAD